jgi:hypothetical protein
MSTRSPLVRAFGLLALIGLVATACGPKPTPGEKDRERGEQAVDELPR